MEMDSFKKYRKWEEQEKLDMRGTLNFGYAKPPFLEMLNSSRILCFPGTSGIGKTFWTMQTYSLYTKPPTPKDKKENEENYSELNLTSIPIINNAKKKEQLKPIIPIFLSGKTSISPSFGRFLLQMKKISELKNFQQQTRTDHVFVELMYLIKTHLTIIRSLLLKKVMKDNSELIQDQMKNIEYYKQFAKTKRDYDFIENTFQNLKNDFRKFIKDFRSNFEECEIHIILDEAQTIQTYCEKNNIHNYIWRENKKKEIEENGIFPVMCRFFQEFISLRSEMKKKKEIKS